MASITPLTSARGRRPAEPDGVTGKGYLATKAQASRASPTAAGLDEPVRTLEADPEPTIRRHPAMIHARAPVSETAAITAMGMGIHMARAITTAKAKPRAMARVTATIMTTAMGRERAMATVM